MLKLGLKPCLGTDSLASNDRLSVFAEMAAVAKFFPEIPADIILKMATIWGAQALKRKDLGLINRDVRADLLVIPWGENFYEREGLINHPPEQLGRLYG